ncbi:MAG TPA: hypothetical protein VGI60_04925 [Chthoniobacterales bacterium]|jgi:hypothetical protein
MRKVEGIAWTIELEYNLAIPWPAECFVPNIEMMDCSFCGVSANEYGSTGCSVGGPACVRD